MISVVILSKTASNLIPCVEAVRKNEPHVQICVVDDGLSSEEQIAVYYLQASIVRGDKPFIFARNANIGIKAALALDLDVTTMSDGAPKFIAQKENEFRGVVLLNDDALLETYEGLTVMAQAAQDNPQYGIIGATCNNVGNRNQWPQKVGLRTDPRMVCFVCAYIPRTTINRVGLLDERFVGYGFEDDDYCVRVRKAGLLVGIHDGCYCNHGALKSTFRGEPSTAANLVQNGTIFRQKWGCGNHEI